MEIDNLDPIVDVDKKENLSLSNNDEDLSTSSDGTVVISMNLPQILDGWNGDYSLTVNIPKDGSAISNRAFVECLLSCYKKLSDACNQVLDEKRTNEILTNFRQFWEKNQHLQSSFWNSPQSALRISSDFADNVNNLFNKKAEIEVTQPDFEDVVLFGVDDDDTRSRSKGDTQKQKV